MGVGGGGGGAHHNGKDLGERETSLSKWSRRSVASVNGEEEKAEWG